jgi:hypothetical protein
MSRAQAIGTIMLEDAAFAVSIVIVLAQVLS